MSGSLAAYPTNPSADTNVLLLYSGTPNRSIEWSASGTGTIIALSNSTNDAGAAAAVYTPGTVGDTIVITVNAGA